MQLVDLKHRWAARGSDFLLQALDSVLYIAVLREDLFPVKTLTSIAARISFRAAVAVTVIALGAAGTTGFILGHETAPRNELVTVQVTGDYTADYLNTLYDLYGQAQADRHEIKRLMPYLQKPSAGVYAAAESNDQAGLTQVENHISAPPLIRAARKACMDHAATYNDNIAWFADPTNPEFAKNLMVLRDLGLPAKYSTNLCNK